MSTYTQEVNSKDLYNNKISKPFAMIDNYIYLYHTDTLIALPVYPESIQDSMGTEFSSQTPMSRSAPIYSYTSSGPRQLQISLPLHRDMMDQVNTSVSTLNIEELQDDDYVDLMIKQLQSAALPAYAASAKMVNPPVVAIRLGNSIFCKGVLIGGVTATHSGPIVSYGTQDKYALVTISFSITEIDPYDAHTVALEGGYRGIRTTLERRVYTK